MVKRLSVFVLVLFISAPVAVAEIVTGKVTSLQVPTNADVTTIYFKIDPMPQAVKEWFFIRAGSGESAGCSLTGNEKTTDRAYSALLTAQASGKTVTLAYCPDTNGYGLVNEFVRINNQ
ncbi:hypothetical protein [Rheinheimera nanhaiensis]|uniref:Uncharacterized protein n=1 Tax=Rheinheimera nanhaiensis E407-8 TaxID=562729 RepID=I1DVY6_9GAMM|nr:hypothetical protein [Rheinheimera nanhaiensis]GAB58214.1 hypothetical protein RNAN_1185 [Rheinheimera nanhaiensis E407-8]